MTLKRHMIVATGSVVCAIGIGFVMQNTAAFAAKTDVAAVSDFNNPTVVTPQLRNPTRDDYDSLPQFSQPGMPAVPGLARPSANSPQPTQDAQCGVEISGTVQPSAMVDLRLDAPCWARARATLHHRGMMVSIAMDENGHAQTTVPALNETADFIVAFDQNHGAMAEFQVPELRGMKRAVLQWQGDNSFELHAYENGAQFGDVGHVWAGAAEPGQGNVVTLGDADGQAAFLAQVYTFPADRNTQVSLEALARVTEANCADEVAAQSLQFDADGALSSVDLVMTMPDCGAVDDFLILQNMFGDLKLALK